MSIKDEENIYKEIFNSDIPEIYKDRFIKIPCEFFTYLQWDDKLLLTLSSLLKRKTIYNTAIVCLKDMIIENNYIPTTGKNRTVEQFRESLFNLFEIGMIEFCSNNLQTIIEKKTEHNSEYEKLKNSITTNTVLALKFNEEKLKILTSKNFTMLEFNVIFKLKQYCEQNPSVKMANLINTYILLKKHVEANKENPEQDQGYSIESLRKTLNVSNKTVINSIKALKDIKLLFVNKKDGKNFYSLTKKRKSKGTLEFKKTNI